MEGTEAAASSACAPAAGAPAPAGWTFHNVGASGLAVASLVLLLLYLTTRFLWLYNRDAARTAASRPSASLPAAAAASPDPSSLLPVFVVLHLAAPGVEQRAECAVCLTEFGAREACRVLPRCGHGFHEECIATWLRVNTTCPLCRAPVAVATN